MTQIEHVNITVPNIDDAIAFLKVIAPDFHVRKDSKLAGTYRWAHIGNEKYYFALQEPHLDSVPRPRLQPYKNYGMNHVALVVSNVEEVEQRLIANGYKKGIDTPVEKYRKRIYYYDKAGFEWEMVEYLSDEASERFLYE